VAILDSELVFTNCLLHSEKMVKKNWTTADMPQQDGKVIVVTGATSGLGYETAIELAKAGATVILVGRSVAKGQEALRSILNRIPNAKVEFEAADLASLKSVAEFAKRVIAKNEKLDILINNAGIMSPPKREVTEDGFEIQFVTNYLSHFALTAHLLPLLQKSPSPRVISLGSVAYRRAKIHFEDLQWEKGAYNYDVYSQSKLAVLMFALELQKRSDANGWGISSIAAHPGFAQTDIITKGPGDGGLFYTVAKWTKPLASHSAASGALSILFAATSPEAVAGEFYGPGGWFELKGSPAKAYIADHARDQLVATKLWDVSVALTGAKWPDSDKIQKF